MAPASDDQLCTSPPGGDVSVPQVDGDGVGGRVKGAVCQVVVRAGRVRLDFLHGVRLTDPYRLLAGTAKSKRHVAIATAADARRPGVAALIRESADLDPDSWPDIKP
jgi:hypothetical protein